MIKKLVNSEEEFINFLVQYLFAAQKEWDVQDIEEIFGIEFYNKKGQLPSEFEDKDDECDEYDNDSDVDYTKYKVQDPELLPQSYPCIVLIEFDKSFDRTGDIETQLVEYVHLLDFVKKTSSIKWTSTQKMSCGFHIVSESNHAAFVQMPSCEIGENYNLTEEELKEFDKLSWNELFHLWQTAK